MWPKISLKITSISTSSLGFSFPSFELTENYFGKLSTSFNLNFIGTADVFLNFNCLLIAWFNKILVNTIGEPYNIYKVGFDPKHLKGKTKGLGLFLIITISSSLYYLAYIGMAQILTYCWLFPDSTDNLSTDTLNTFLLYSGFP